VISLFARLFFGCAYAQKQKEESDDDETHPESPETMG
jgi:hypothetical protein